MRVARGLRTCGLCLLVGGCAPAPPLGMATATPWPTATYTAAEAAFAAHRNPLSGLPSTDPDIHAHQPNAFAVVAEAGQQLPAGAQLAELAVEVLDPATPGFTLVTQEQPDRRPALGPLGPLTPRDVVVAQALGAGATAATAPAELADRLLAAGLPLTVLQDTPGAATPIHAAGTPRWSFSESPDPRAGATDGVSVRTPTGTPLEWRHDPVFATWRRWVNGRPVGDPTTGEPLTAVNVVVMVVPGAPGRPDWWRGSGQAWLLRDGTRLDGRWLRADDAAPMGLVDEHGLTWALRPGNTWWTVVTDPTAVQWTTAAR